MQTAIGFDVGRSSVKVVASWGARREQILYPSSVCPAFALTDEEEAARSEAETAIVNGKPWFTGNTAALQGGDDMLGGLRDDWAFSEQHAALFLAGMRKLRDAGVPGLDTALIVLGLPAALYASQRAGLAQELARHAPRAELRVMPQPLGPYQQLLFDPDGSETADFRADDTSWGVVEVGQYTTDYALLLQGRTIENAYGSCEGMHIAAQQLQRTLRGRSFAVTLSESSKLLETKTLRNFGESVDVTDEVERSVRPLADQIVDKANQLIGKSARTLDGVLVAGGGASLVLPALQRAWPHARMLENPRFSVAEGFARYARAFNAYRQSRAAATGTEG